MSTPLNPEIIPQFVNDLVIPPVYEPTVVKTPILGRVKSHDYTVTVSEFTQQILPDGFPETIVWGYGGKVRDPKTDEIIPDFCYTPGASFEATRGIPVNVQWVNCLTGPHLLQLISSLIFRHYHPAQN